MGFISVNHMTVNNRDVSQQSVIFIVHTQIFFLDVSIFGILMTQREFDCCEYIWSTGWVVFIEQSRALQLAYLLQFHCVQPHCIIPQSIVISPVDMNSLCQDIHDCSMNELCVICCTREN